MSKSDTENVQAKRYYWLKLQNTYFSQLEQKKMRRQEHGKDMQIIYLRMMLYSIDKSGLIYYQGIYDTLEEEMAEEFDEPVELIKRTLDYLIKNNMISLDKEHNCFIPAAIEYTGSESYSTERMRRHRKKDKASHCDADVTPICHNVTGSDVGVTSSDTDVIPCDEEKEIEKELEKDIKHICAPDVAPFSEKSHEKNFETMWELYPVKKGKGKVSYSSKKKLLNISLEEMKRAIKRYCDYVNSVSYLNYQNGSTFFNGSYIDYLDINYKQEQKPNNNNLEIMEEDRFHMLSQEVRSELETLGVIDGESLDLGNATKEHIALLQEVGAL